MTHMDAEIDEIVDRLQAQQEEMMTFLITQFPPS